MNADRIIEIKERCKKATPAPWGMDKGRKVMYLSENWKTEVASASLGMRGYDDANFIAHSREDIPFLLSEIEALQIQLMEAVSNNRRIVCERERLCKQLSASQARERAAANELCDCCKSYARAVNLKTDCLNCQWRGPQDGKGEAE